MTRIAGVASAFPRQYYRQQEIANVLKRHWDDGLGNPKVLDRLLTRVGVDGRYLALPIEAYDDLTTWGKSNNAWIEVAEELAEQSICRALTRAGFCEADLDAIFFVSVTGVASPSIDARLMNRMNLRPDIKRNPIFGLGCVAGAAGLARAADYVRAFPEQCAVLVSVELCSLTWQRKDLSVANLISSGLFGDGSAAVIVAGSERSAAGPQVLGSRSSFYRGTEEVMGWNISEQGFRIVLSPEVPEMVRQHLARDVDGFLADYGLDRGDIDTWIMHTGGPKVLEATAQSLDLPDGALDVSWQTLRRVGNLSSASVLLVLEEFMNRRRPEAGSYSILAAMGPGFCSELVLLRW
ncbi:MAG TPA: 3-oxoacyl-[acyl-carrier-protein] synthase III C-terminal domain-containing protein [Candidatus Limnocylindrales bacterium]|nr:3-oxoacyl-[acyl-carrier-protein] synthase III C-terminal domain-containing protein [Candidatus Limnocylindrales bacterium]